MRFLTYLYLSFAPALHSLPSVSRVDPGPDVGLSVSEPERPGRRVASFSVDYHQRGIRSCTRAYDHN